MVSAYATGNVELLPTDTPIMEPLPARETHAQANGEQATEAVPGIGIVGVSLSAESCGLELVRSDDFNFQFEYMGIDDTSLFTVECDTDGDLLNIHVNGSRARSQVSNYNVETGTRYSNVVRIWVPDQLYEDFDIDLTAAPITMPDIEAAVNISSVQGSIAIQDGSLSKGKYTITGSTGSVEITAGYIGSDIYVENRGDVELNFLQEPVNSDWMWKDLAGK